MVGDAIVTRKGRSGPFELHEIPPITDQRGLKKTAVTSSNPFVRMGAIVKIDDERFLAWRAIADPDEHTAFEAARRLHDESLALRAASKTPHRSVRELLIPKISDGRFLYRAAEERGLSGMATQTAEMAKERILELAEPLLRSRGKMRAREDAMYRGARRA